MAKIYYNLINAGLWELENVPMRWREDVENLLAADRKDSPTPPTEETPDSPESEVPIDETSPNDQESNDDGNVAE